MNHRRRKNKEEKILGESALEVCSFKKGFEEHGDILTCIWQDQVWLQFIAALSSALGKTEPTASRWRGAKEEHIRAVTLLTLSQLFSAPSLFHFPALLDSKKLTKGPKALMLQQLWAPHRAEQAAPRLGAAGWVVCSEERKELHPCSVSHTEQSESLARPWLESGAFASPHAVQMAA